MRLAFNSRFFSPGLPVILLMACLLLPASVSALEFEGLGGVEFDSRSQGYRYIGIGLRTTIDDHWTVLARVTGSSLRYTFESGNDTLTANVMSITPMFGTQYKKGPMTLALLAGKDFRSTNRDVVGAPHETDRDTSLVIQAELDYWFGHIYDLGLISSYTDLDRYFWNRVRIKKQLTNLDYSGTTSWFIGGEGVGSGNVDFNSYQLGAVVEYSYRPLKMSWVLKGGFKTTSTVSRSGYTGIEFYFTH